MSNRGGVSNEATSARLVAASAASSAVPGAVPGAAQPQSGPLSIDSLTRATLTDWFGGQRLTNEDIRAMAGGGPGASVSARLTGRGTVDFHVRGPLLPDLPDTGYENLGTAAYVMHRVLGRGLDSTHPDALVMLNERFMMRDEMKGQGLGTALFARQAQTLTRLGHVAEIGTQASRSGNAVDGYVHNGFYTWALLGYDTPMSLRYDTSQLRRTPTTRSPLARRIARDPQARDAAERTYTSYGEQHSRTALALTPLSLGTKARLLTLAARGKLHLSDVLATPDGRRWWKYHGESKSLTFDLTPGSRSQQTLATYLARRASEGRAVSVL